ncbi:helix-turn-helix domain-containing protein [Desulforapulum autotrophicum]|nr:helix-turn-helix domain-containing protein [Desulforapulum autotrophicum]
MKQITLKIDIPEDFEALFHALLNNQAAPAPQPADDETWTFKDLCKEYKLPKTKGYALTMQTGPGSIPRFKIGRDLRFRKSEVEAWFLEQRVK